MSAIIGETVTIGQSKGPDVRLRVTGDEFFAIYETEDGYAAVNDTALGLFCYGRLEQGALVSSGVPISEAPPAGIARHLRESPELRRGRAEMRHRPAHSPGGERVAGGPAFMLGRNEGLLYGRRLSSGTVRGLTVLVDFQDIKSPMPAQEIDALLNGQDYTGNGNFCSVRQYFLAMSSGKLDYRNDVVGPFLLSRNRDFYVENFLGREVMEQVVASGLDLGRYDSLQEGVVDVVNIMYAGATQYAGGLWPHNRILRLDYGGFQTHHFVVCGANSSSAELSIGTFCHETGHALCAFPDLYDYGSGDGDAAPSAGIGMYCVMGIGAHADNGRTPSPVCVYLRDLVGWCDTEIDLNSAGEVEAVHGAYDTVLKFRADAPNEYFLVENRARIGLDQHLPSHGLAIYHCDTLGSNELQQGAAERHYQCALLQADRRFDLESNANNGDLGDLFSAVDGTAVSHATTPSTRLWNGAESGLAISNVGESGERMRFRVDADMRVIAREAAPTQPIYRSNDGSSIHIAHAGTVRRLKVTVDITHPHIGNLSVELFSPAGHRVRLHNLRGGDADDLRVTYDSAAPLSPLAPLTGEAMQGNWTLTIADLGARRSTASRGTLNKWLLEISPEL